jgi:hypothetical protein
MKYFLTLLVSFFVTATAHAHGGDGFGQIFNMFFGNESDRHAVATCDSVDGKGGILGVVNGFFCHMEKDMGIKGVTTGVTKVMGNMSVRAVVTAGAYTVNSVNYDYNAQVWVCFSPCASTASFSRAINFYFSYAADKTINKGQMLMNPNAFQSGGSATSALNIQYDVGTSTANKTITAKAIFVDGTVTQRIRVDGDKSANLTGVTGVMHNGTNGFRFAARLDTVANTGGVYYEAPGATGSGTAALNAGLAGDDKTSSSMCFSRAPSGSDWTYTPGATGCTVKIFPADSNATVSGYTTASILTVSTLWEGMTANPSSI